MKLGSSVHNQPMLDPLSDKGKEVVIDGVNMKRQERRMTSIGEIERE